MFSGNTQTMCSAQVTTPWSEWRLQLPLPSKRLRSKRNYGRFLKRSSGASPCPFSRAQKHERGCFATSKNGLRKNFNKKLDTSQREIPLWCVQFFYRKLFVHLYIFPLFGLDRLRRKHSGCFPPKALPRNSSLIKGTHRLRKPKRAVNRYRQKLPPLYLSKIL